MDHVAILKSGPLDKILSGEKTIESRWLVHKSAPFGKVNGGDVLYLKRTGGKVEARVTVHGVKQFENLTLEVARTIIKRYGPSIKLNNTNFRQWWNPKKKYCCLIFLKNVERLAPFDIDKTGFGNMAAWLVLPRGIGAIAQKP